MNTTMMKIHSLRFTTFAAAALAIACSSSSDARSNADSSTTAATANGDVTVGPSTDAVPAGAIRYTVSATGNAARYRVREQLMGKDLPNDAIGETTEITGMITVDSTTGTLIPGQSKFTINTSAFKSDSDRRDGYVRGRLLEATKYPAVEFVPTGVRGLTAASAAASGPKTFELVGDLTVKGVTRPTTWKVTAQQAPGRATGSASTKFTFADITMNPPKVPILLSVADTIALEYDFTMLRDKP
jgi:polyisoprenoid-binding protein YceI